MTLPNGEPDAIRATLDTSPLTVGSWRVRIRLTEVDRGRRAATSGDAERRRRRADVYEGSSDPIEVTPRPFAAGDDVAVTLKRTAVPPTAGPGAVGGDPQQHQRPRLRATTAGSSRPWCAASRPTRRPAGSGRKGTGHTLRKVKRRTALPFPNVDRYRLLKAATEVFLMIHCGVDLDDFTRRRPGRGEPPAQPHGGAGRPRGSRCATTSSRVAAGEGEFLDVLPYLGLIRLQLRDVADRRAATTTTRPPQICYGILAEKLTNPCFLELLWSYWHDEGGLVQTHERHQLAVPEPDRRPAGAGPAGRPGHRPAAPAQQPALGLRPGRSSTGSSTLRRAYEYDHQYGLVLVDQAGAAGARRRLPVAVHRGVPQPARRCAAEFYRQDDDTTVIADGFGVLNALKETHLLLTEGAHNQYGDLPWTARHEMLMYQWILARPEMREFLPDADHGRLPGGVDGPGRGDEQAAGLVRHRRCCTSATSPCSASSCCSASGSAPGRTVNEPEQAANWARYWRSEMQGYIHAYRAVTGVDLIQRRRPLDPRLPPAPPAAAPTAAERCGRRRPARRRPGGRRRGSSTPTATPGPATGSPGRGTPRRRWTATCAAATRPASARSNLFAAFHSDYAVANEEVGRIVAGRPGRFFGFAFVHADRDRGRILLDGAAGRGRARASAASRCTGTTPASAVRSATPPGGSGCRSCTTRWARSPRRSCWPSEYPDVDFVIPHLGSFADDWSAQLAFCDLLADRPNLYRRHLRRPPVRPAGAGGPARRAAQGAVRVGRPVAAPRAGAGEDPSCCGCRRRRVAGRGRELPAPHPGGAGAVAGRAASTGRHAGPPARRPAT